MKKLIISVWAFIALPLFAQRDANIRIYPEQGNQQISKHIYGQFAEHLGSCIYGGLWVGPESDIPNTQGYRTDVLNALKKLQIPNLRWPGGCFADEYHWMDGIGPKENRPKMVNNNWGGTIEDNSFGTHEFLNLCELLGCEPYISGNVGSGTVEEMAKWVEYMTSEGDSPMANLRRKNGRDKAWKVKFFGVGNESWGCGGSMRPEYYSDLYRRYSTYCRNYDSNVLFKIASGASDYDYNWTETLMKQIGGRMDGISLHYYTVGDWNNKGSATDFNTEDYYWTLGKCLEIKDVVKKHPARGCGCVRPGGHHQQGPDRGAGHAGEPDAGHRRGDPPDGARRRAGKAGAAPSARRAGRKVRRGPGQQGTGQHGLCGRERQQDGRAPAHGQRHPFGGLFAAHAQAHGRHAGGHLPAADERR